MTQENPIGCGGLLGGCLTCREMYLEAVEDGTVKGVCVICDQAHWPWETHVSEVG
jgi:hypothetical protein